MEDITERVRKKIREELEVEDLEPSNIDANRIDMRYGIYVFESVNDILTNSTRLFDQYERVYGFCDFQSYFTKTDVYEIGSKGIVSDFEDSVDVYCCKLPEITKTLKDREIGVSFEIKGFVFAGYAPHLFRHSDKRLRVINIYPGDSNDSVGPDSNPLSSRSLDFILSS